MNPASRLLMSALAIAAGAAIVGCGGKDDRPANWSYISTAIIQPNCATANCHSALSARSAIDLSTIAGGYHALADRRFAPRCDPQSTDPATQCDAQNTALHHLLRGEGTRRMPPDSVLPLDDMLLIDRWMQSGSLNDVGGGTP